MKFMKRLFSLLLILSAIVSVNAQTGELVLERGVSADKEIDAIYKSFSEAYRILDVEKVANLYTENAAYLPPDNDILNGRAEIRPTFESFFDYVKSEGRAMTISFQIFQRKVDKNLAYDVGIYTIRQYKDSKEIGVGKGKFVVVAVKEKGGKWRFQVDCYSALQPSEKK
jgi:uncharacterized protein (TIGR02246 family)